MTITELSAALQFDMADRMRKALRVAGYSPSQMADDLEVHRNAVSSWINGRNTPRRRELRKFAELTGVSVEWLETGEESRPRESNSRPSHYKANTRPTERAFWMRAA